MQMKLSDELRLAQQRIISLSNNDCWQLIWFIPIFIIRRNIKLTYLRDQMIWELFIKLWLLLHLYNNFVILVVRMIVKYLIKCCHQRFKRMSKSSQFNIWFWALINIDFILLSAKVPHFKCTIRRTWLCINKIILTKRTFKTFRLVST